MMHNRIKISLIILSIFFTTLLVIGLLSSHKQEHTENQNKPKTVQQKKEKVAETPTPEVAKSQPAQETEPVVEEKKTPVHTKAVVNKPIEVPVQQPVAPQLAPNEAEAIVNAVRSNNGVSTLSSNQKLRNSACAKAQDMLSKQYWAHTAPDGATPWTFISGAGYRYIIAGENLAYGFSDTKSTIDGWMNSQTHRDNMLNANFTEQGICSLPGQFMGEYTTITVQHLGKR